MTDNIAPEEVRFSKNATILANALYESIETLYNAGYQTINPSLIQMAATMISSFDKHYLIQGFIENSHIKCWDLIKVKNEEFILKNSGEIFKYLPMNKVNLFVDLFTTKDQNGNFVISDDLKEEIWTILQAMVKISIKYVHKMRTPQCVIINNNIENIYTSSFFDDIDLNKHCKVWNITIEFPHKK